MTVTFPRWLMPLLLPIILAGGCSLWNTGADAPFERELLSFRDQRNAIIEIVPVGTPRSEVAEKLEAAGVSFTPSQGDSPAIFYCESWNRDRRRILMSLQLVFDEDGNLKGTRPTPIIDQDET